MALKQSILSAATAIPRALRTLVARWTTPPPVVRGHVRPAPWSEPRGVGAAATAERVRVAVAAAENGRPAQLLALYRDAILSCAHLQAELQRRKSALLGQPCQVVPASDSDIDQSAAQAVQDMIDGCEDWTVGLSHLMDSVLLPVSVARKEFGPDPTGRYRYRLEHLRPVSHALLMFRSPFEAVGADQWEPELRLYAVDERGRIVADANKASPLDPQVHVVHRAHALSSWADHWGGPMRAVIYWWLLASLAREWWARLTERYGAPFIVVHADLANEEIRSYLEQALSESTRIGGLMIDPDTRVELQQAALTGTADNFSRFIALCNREMSNVIVGDTLGSEVQPTGLGSGVARLQAGIREDLVWFDSARLNDTLRRQVFAQWLEINGIPGRAPRLVWGAEAPIDARATAMVLSALAQAGLEPTEEAYPVLADRLGFSIQKRRLAPVLPPEPQSALQTLSAAANRTVDEIVQDRIDLLTRIYSRAYEPLIQAVAESASAEEAAQKLRAAVSELDADEMVREIETAMQIAAAAGLVTHV